MPGTETSPIFQQAIWAGPQAMPWNVTNPNFRITEALVRGSVEARDLTAPPGVCDDGAAYLVAAGGTGAWDGQDGLFAVAVGEDAANGWLFAPVGHEGFRLWVKDEGVRIRFDGADWVPDALLELAFSFEATPGASEVVGRIRLARDIVIPADMVGAFAGVDANPTATFDIDVQDDGVSIATISVAVGGAVTFTTDGGTEQAVDAGSEIAFIAPVAPDATVAGMSAVVVAVPVG